jgi:hypothetical protein
MPPRSARRPPSGPPVSAHHEDRRIYAEVAAALQQALCPEQGVACSRHDHVQQQEIEALSLQDVQRLGDRPRRRNLISVPVLEGGEDLPQQVEHVWLVNDDQPRVNRSSSLRPRLF